MAIISTINGLNVVSLPCDYYAGVPAPVSIEWDPHEVVSQTVSPFTGAAQTFDWQQSFFEGHVSLPPMTRAAADAWQAFIMQCRGPLNAFLIGDPKAKFPKGVNAGAPSVDGAGQTGYVLRTRGWTPSTANVLQVGDYISVGGYRLYRVLDNATSDSAGKATISIWPNVRDIPADGVAIITQNCRGLFRLSNANGNKFSVNARTYGFTGFAIREAL